MRKGWNLPLPTVSGIIDRDTYNYWKAQRSKKVPRKPFKIELPVNIRDDVLTTLDKVTFVRRVYVVEGSEWLTWAMQRGAAMNLNNVGKFSDAYHKTFVVPAEVTEEALREIEVQLSFVPHMVPEKSLLEEMCRSEHKSLIRRIASHHHKNLPPALRLVKPNTC